MQNKWVSAEYSVSADSNNLGFGRSLGATVGGNDAVEDYGISLCKLTKTTEDFDYYTGFQPRFTVSFRKMK